MYAMPHSHARLKRIGTGREALERTTGFDLAVPTFGNGMADVSCVSTGLTSAPEARGHLTASRWY